MVITYSGALFGGKIFLNNVYLESFFTSTTAITIPSGLNIAPTADSTTFFRFFRLWNIYIRHYSAMQMRYRGLNYF